LGPENNWLVPAEGQVRIDGDWKEHRTLKYFRSAVNSQSTDAAHFVAAKATNEFRAKVSVYGARTSEASDETPDQNALPTSLDWLIAVKKSAHSSKPGIRPWTDSGPGWRTTMFSK
jgi:hypothetical protein